jgi:hypothetical protein
VSFIEAEAIGPSRDRSKQVGHLKGPASGFRNSPPCRPLSSRQTAPLSERSVTTPANSVEMAAKLNAAPVDRAQGGQLRSLRRGREAVQVGDDGVARVPERGQLVALELE